MLWPRLPQARPLGSVGTGASVMIGMASVPQPAPPHRAAAAPVQDVSQRLDEIVSTLELIAEAYGKSGDDSPVTLSSLLYQIGVQAGELGGIADEIRFKE